MFFISVVLSFIHKNADWCLYICRPAHGNLDVIFNGGTRRAGIKAGMREQVMHTGFWWGGVLEVDLETAVVEIGWKDQRWMYLAHDRVQLLDFLLLMLTLWVLLS
jgi:hypothetical protein